jgi:hypothetical protein
MTRSSFPRLLLRGVLVDLGTAGSMPSQAANDNEAAVTPRTAGDPTTEPGPGKPATQPEWDIEPNDNVQSR